MRPLFTIIEMRVSSYEDINASKNTFGGNIVNDISEHMWCKYIKNKLFFIDNKADEY